MKILLIYLALVNLAAAVTVAYDKAISRRPRGSVRRVPEKRFVQLALLGGGVGTLLCMALVRHKTKTKKALQCKLGALTVLWIALVLWVVR